ncbi:MAG TPA: DsbA family protein [Thiobacillaceae bacterium]|nr:DsbA family protein [Thiobacillaceae bacterium]
MNAGPILWYFADPMCSWCWGFSPAIEAVREMYREQTKISLVLGGLRPGSAEALSAQGREEILHHRHQVHERTGQPFKFEDALPAGFVYDTEPACRAVAAMGELDPTLIFPMFKAVQSAFYAEGLNVTQAAVLTDLAASLGVESQRFAPAFASHAAKTRTEAHFRLARQWGIKGFPTLILQRDKNVHLITSGWQPILAIRAAIDAGLSKA